MSTAQALLNWEAAWLGTTETGENHQPFAAIAGHKNGQPWCATFQVAAAKSTGLVLPPGADTAYTPSMWNAFKRAGQAVSTPQPGDWGFVWYESMNRIGHVFAVREVLSDRRVLTCEGNGNQIASRTGGQVSSLQRDYVVRGSAYVYGFARPAYDGTESPVLNLPPSAFHSGITATPAVHAIVTGEPLAVDGRLGPKTITRWQAVMGTPMDGIIDDRDSSLVKSVQLRLNSVIGAGLVVDGDLGPNTIKALQRYLGTPIDGKISIPVSAMVRALQARLNTGAF